MSGGAFRRYDQDPKLALYFAVQLAAHRREEQITVEDILLGLTWRNHSQECEFRGLKDDAEELWEFIGVPHLPITNEPYESKKTPLSDAAKRVLAYTKMEADQCGQYWIDLDHMLCGIIREGGLAATALQQTGWTTQRIKAAGAHSRKKWPPKPVPFGRRLQMHWRWIAAIFGAVFLAGIVLYLRSQDHP